MNLWLRLLYILMTFRSRGRLASPFDLARVGFRVLPNDLDTNLHMNNGRYAKIMDLGRLDFILRLGLADAIRRNGWMPVLSGMQILFRREMRVFEAYTLESRLAGWVDTSVVFEQRFIKKGADGAPVVAAIGLLRAGFYDRKAKRFISVDEIMDAIGISAQSPPLAPEVEAFLAANAALRALA